jgi:hypothetical protein
MGFIRAIFRDYPVVAAVLLLLTCIKLQYCEDNWSAGTLGLAAGFPVLLIIAIVLLFRIFNAAQDVCVARGLIPSRIHSKYDLLIPVGIVAMLHVRYKGVPFLSKTGEHLCHWDFQWGDPEWSGPFFVTLIGVVLLVRILYLLRSIAKTPRAG